MGIIQILYQLRMYLGQTNGNRKKVKEMDKDKEFSHTTFRVCLKNILKDGVVEMTFTYPEVEGNKFKEIEENLKKSDIPKKALKLLRQWEKLSYEISGKYLELTAIDSMLRNQFYVVPELTTKYDLLEWKEIKDAQADKKK